MSPAISLNLDQFKCLSSGNGLDMDESTVLSSGRELGGVNVLRYPTQRHGQ